MSVACAFHHFPASGSVGTCGIACCGRPLAGVWAKPGGFVTCAYLVLYGFCRMAALEAPSNRNRQLSLACPFAHARMCEQDLPGTCWAAPKGHVRADVLCSAACFWGLLHSCLSGIILMVDLGSLVASAAPSTAHVHVLAPAVCQFSLD